MKSWCLCCCWVNGKGHWSSARTCVEIVVNAGDIPWANLHQRDGSTREENSEEEKRLSSPDIRQSANQWGAQERQQTLWPTRTTCLQLLPCFTGNQPIRQQIQYCTFTPCMRPFIKNVCLGNVSWRTWISKNNNKDH